MSSSNTTPVPATEPVSLGSAARNPANDATASLDSIRIDPSSPVPTTSTVATNAAPVNTANGPMSPRSYLRFHRYGTPAPQVPAASAPMAGAQAPGNHTGDSVSFSPGSLGSSNTLGPSAASSPSAGPPNIPDDPNMSISNRDHRFVLYYLRSLLPSDLLDALDIPEDNANPLLIYSPGIHSLFPPHLPVDQNVPNYHTNTQLATSALQTIVFAPNPFDLNSDHNTLQRTGPRNLGPRPIIAPHPTLWSCHNDGCRNSCCLTHCTQCHHSRCKKCYIWPAELVKELVENEEVAEQEATKKTDEMRDLLNFVFPGRPMKVWPAEERERRWNAEKKSLEAEAAAPQLGEEERRTRTGKWIIRGEAQEWERSSGWESARGWKFADTMRRTRGVAAEDSVSDAGASASRFTDDEESVVDSLSRVSLIVEPSESAFSDSGRSHRSSRFVDWNDPEADSEVDGPTAHPNRRRHLFDHGDWNGSEESVDTGAPPPDVDTDREETPRVVLPPPGVPGRERRGAVDFGGSREGNV